jgi:hypothetical protein
VITFPQRAVQSFPVGWGLSKLFGTFSLILVQGFCGILPDFLGAEQLSILLKLLVDKDFRFVQQALGKQAPGYKAAQKALNRFIAELASPA